MLKFNFKNKTVIVTGAGAGIGKATGLMFAQAGANVAFVSRTPYDELLKEIQIFEGRAKFFKADVSNELEVNSILAEIVESFGAPDILINNASVAKAASIEDTSAEDWDWVFENNVKSTFMFTKGVVSYFKHKNSGKVVNVSSIAGRDKSLLLGASYSSSKAAIIGFTRHLATELSPWKINVNCVCPSQTRTPMLDNIFSKDDSLEDMLINKNPLGYIMEPRQLANVILFLSSEESNYIQGAIIDVNGGLL